MEFQITRDNKALFKRSISSYEDVIQRSWNNSILVLSRMKTPIAYVLVTDV